MVNPVATSSRSAAAAKVSGPGRPKDLGKRAAILDAAMALFPSRGYDGVSMDAIAQSASVSKLTVYNHFADKESLLLGFLARERYLQLPPMPSGDHVVTAVYLGSSAHAGATEQMQLRVSAK